MNTDDSIDNGVGDDDDDDNDDRYQTLFTTGPRFGVGILVSWVYIERAFFFLLQRENTVLLKYTPGIIPSGSSFK